MVTHPSVDQAHGCLTSVIGPRMVAPCQRGSVGFIHFMKFPAILVQVYILCVWHPPPPIDQTVSLVGIIWWHTVGARGCLLVFHFHYKYLLKLNSLYRQPRFCKLKFTTISHSQSLTLYWSCDLWKPLFAWSINQMLGGTSTEIYAQISKIYWKLFIFNKNYLFKSKRI